MEESLVTIRQLSAAAITAGLSMAISVLIVLSKRWHGKHSLDHDLAGVQKFHTQPVPRIGGIAIVVAIFMTLVGANFFSDVSFLSEEDLRYGALLLVAGLPAFAAGATEDLTKRVSVKTRLLASVASALLASWLLGATVDELNLWGIDVLLAWAPVALVVTAVAVAGGVNAVNIIDGFNGLAACTVVVMLGALAAVAWQVGDSLVTALALIGLGAAFGFLIVNYPSGKLFLGDGGAYFLGFWVAEIVVLLLVRNAAVNAWQVLSICAYPVIEVLFSIYRRRFLRNSSPGAPDGLHLHTLVYRRFLSRIGRTDASQPWKRNAAVACVVVPCVAVAGVSSVALGTTIVGGISLVVAQLVLYLAVYARLVRGRWTVRPVERLISTERAEVSPS